MTQEYFVEGLDNGFDTRLLWHLGSPGRIFPGGDFPGRIFRGGIRSGRNFPAADFSPCHFYEVCVFNSNCSSIPKKVQGFTTLLL